jgi:hypothetical protein
VVEAEGGHAVNQAPTQRERREDLLADRRVARPAQLDRAPFCQLRVTDACRRKAQEATDVHEIVRRGQGGSIVDPPNLLSACHRCHMIVTTHPLFGEAIGACLPSWVLKPWLATTGPQVVALVAYEIAAEARLRWRRFGWSMDFVLRWSKGKAGGVEADAAAARREAA